ncbi:hypothetical protein GCM10023321_02760 [Pseudonocardia eucalypti]|uniref:Uncharacterized protein n=1 Tax=Pseudonocardia eucalypti TaxID=648755 RepID=A0ABP9PGA0_9PSEU
MLDLGAAESSRQAGSPTDPTEELVGVLAARTANEGAPAKAVAEIGRRRENGRTPIGLYRLSEVLARPSDSGGEVSASVEALTDDPELIVEVVRRYPCALLDIATPAGLARTLEAVLMDGKRVLVSGTDAETLRLVRRALPDTAADLCLDEALPLSDSEQRELRSLLITATPARRARLEQALPESEQLPSTEEVARLCREAGGECGPAADAAETPETVGPAMLVPELVGSLEPPRLSTLRTAATRCVTALDAVDAEDDEDTPWSREALSGVVFGSGRTALTNLLRRTADVVQTADKLRDAGDQMAVTGEISDEEQELLRDYANFLDSGGRSRSYFRSARQRAVEPVLGKLRLEAPVQDASVIRQALTFIELVKAMREVGDLGGKLGVPPPTDVPTVDALHKQLVRIKDAGLKAEELRREVQFAHPASPVRVMALADMASIETVARTIVECSDTERLTDARNQLSALADGMVRATPGPTGPEVDALVRALRQHSLPKYREALPRLAAALRERVDQRRMVELLDRLRERAPGLARRWAQAAEERRSPGTVRFMETDALLGALPEADTADLVVLLDAGALGMEHLLVAAAAPRVLAVAGGFASTEPPNPATPPETVLDALRRAGVPVIVAADDQSKPAEPTEPAMPVVPAQREIPTQETIHSSAS